jgi:hypothetical protein
LPQGTPSAKLSLLTPDLLAACRLHRLRACIGAVVLQQVHRILITLSLTTSLSARPLPRFSLNFRYAAAATARVGDVPHRYGFSGHSSVRRQSMHSAHLLRAFDLPNLVIPTGVSCQPYSVVNPAFSLAAPQWLLTNCNSTRGTPEVYVFYYSVNGSCP